MVSEDIENKIDEMVTKAIPIPCKCTWETEKAKHRRQQLKDSIIDIVKNALTLRKE